MYFLSKSNHNNSLYHHTLYLLGKRVSSSETLMDTTSLPVEDFVRSANVYNRKVGYLAWKNASGWEFDDSNYSTLPIATTTLVDEQQDYSIPSNALDIERVEVMDNSGDYVLLNRMNKSEIRDEALSEYYKTSGLPKYYDVVGNSLMLYPKPSASNVTLVAGLKVYLQRDISALTEGSYRNILTEPGFHINFHPYIAYGVAIDYGIAKNYTTEKMNSLRVALKEYSADIENYYAQRDRDYPTKFRPTVRSSI